MDMPNIPKPTRNQLLTAVMAVAVVVVMIMAFAYYPGTNDKNADTDDESPATVVLTVQDGLAVTCNGDKVVSGQAFSLPFNKDGVLKITLPTSGTCDLRYTSQGLGPAGGSESEFGRAGTVVTMYLSNFWCSSITGSITFTPGNLIGSWGEDPATVTLTVQEGINVTCNGEQVVSGQSFSLPFNKDGVLKITLPATGTCDLSYTSQGYGTAGGSESEFGHAGTVVTMYLSNFWCDTITGSITFTPGS
jgi:hypothetical protein